jgi:adenine-specific DNA methylase
MFHFMGLMYMAIFLTPRQLVALTTFSDLVQEVRERVKQDAVAAGMKDNEAGLDDGGTGAQPTPMLLRCIWDLLRLAERSFKLNLQLE